MLAMAMQGVYNKDGLEGERINRSGWQERGGVGIGKREGEGGVESC